MALRDLTGAVDFNVLEATTGGDDAVSEEVLDLFVEQAALWSRLLRPEIEGWRDAVHTLKGTAGGVGARRLALLCAEAESAPSTMAPAALDRVQGALDEVLADIAAYRHGLALRGLRS
ncbi:Hpt domain-containing protein [Brevundimonas sp. S30B]|uniref:Hpt domain-containing protein n=1 Tax=unclassified Brevundimonas TaxID=2622653 RepID=UPI001071C49B|nr:MULTISPECIES: Hpt domain-containing protein [unclassified Brevundimonas]QBX38006.1 Hpt domain-containing protein [Brevundimonas sp. MF30-B]TFW02640.1 Hpt domain-containing protein [Brevundimonas sp. S30B]